MRRLVYARHEFSALASQFATSLLLLKTQLDARFANTTTLASIPSAMMLVDHRSCLRSKLFDSKLLREKCVFFKVAPNKGAPLLFLRQGQTRWAHVGITPRTQESAACAHPVCSCRVFLPSVIDQHVFLTEIAFWQPDSYQVMQILALYLAL